jgi:esterase/lipase superfamily enzyme
VAPDVDRSRFIRLAPQVAASAHRVTVYVSSRDVALMASRRVADGNDRAGQAGRSLVILPPMQTVDASTVETDMLGHSYYVAQPVMDDLVSVIRNRLEPNSRRLVRMRRGQQRYWRFPQH